VKEFIQNYFKNQQLWDSFLTAKNPSLLGKNSTDKLFEPKGRLLLRAGAGGRRRSKTKVKKKRK